MLRLLVQEVKLRGYILSPCAGFSSGAKIAYRKVKVEVKVEF